MNVFGMKSILHGEKTAEPEHFFGKMNMANKEKNKAHKNIWP